jgi:hypothetical protein
MGSGCAACKMKWESCGNLEDLLTIDEIYWNIMGKHEGLMEKVWRIHWK